MCGPVRRYFYFEASRTRLRVPTYLKTGARLPVYLPFDQVGPTLATVGQRDQLDSRFAEAGGRVFGAQVGYRQRQVDPRQVIGQNSGAAFDEQRVEAAQRLSVQGLVFGDRQQQRVKVVQVEGGRQLRHRGGEGGPRPTVFESGGFVAVAGAGADRRFVRRLSLQRADRVVEAGAVFGVLDDDAGGRPAPQRGPPRPLLRAAARRHVAGSVAAVAARKAVRGGRMGRPANQTTRFGRRRRRVLLCVSSRFVVRARDRFGGATVSRRRGRGRRRRRRRR